MVVISAVSGSNFSIMISSLLVVIGAVVVMGAAVVIGAASEGNLSFMLSLLRLEDEQDARTQDISTDAAITGIFHLAKHLSFLFM